MKAENITPINETGEFQLRSGRIETAGELYRIVCDNRHYSADRAFSCLLEPRVDDIVLFCIDSWQHCHILSIIERPHANDAKLAFPGDVTFSADQGKLDIEARTGLNLVSRRELNQVAESFSVVSRKGLISIDDLTAIGSSLIGRIKRIQTYADRLETVAGHCLQKLKNSIRLVDGVDQLRAGNVMHEVGNLFSLRSKQSVMLAKKDIRMDAERIHMG